MGGVQGAPGAGGFGGGAGGSDSTTSAINTVGGGGAAFGASVFVNSIGGASLTLMNSSTDAGSLVAGQGGGGTATAGTAAGSAVFLDGGDLRVNVTGVNIQTIAGTIAEAIVSGESALTKVGAGTLILTADSGGSLGYSGGTTVQAGTLLANNASGSATGTGAVDVLSNGALGGVGRVSGGVTIESGGQLEPGSLGAIGTLRLAGGLTTTSGSDSEFTLGTNSDLVQVGGGPLSLAGRVDITAGSGFGSGTYDLFSYVGMATLTSETLTVGDAPAGFMYQIVANSALQEVRLIVTGSAVPEPPSLILMGLGGIAYLCLARWRRGRGGD